MFRRHPWLLLAILSVAGAAASLTMVWICSRNAPETVPVENPAVVKP